MQNIYLQKMFQLFVFTANDQSVIAKYSHIIIKLEKNEEKK